MTNEDLITKTIEFLKPKSGHVNVTDTLWKELSLTSEKQMELRDLLISDNLINLGPDNWSMKLTAPGMLFLTANQKIDREDNGVKSNDEAPRRDKLFNLYVRVRDKKQVELAISRDDLDIIFTAISDGKETIRVCGRKLTIKDYDTFKIYEISNTMFKGNRASVKNQMEKDNRIIFGKWNTQALKMYGEDVTFDFDVPEFDFNEEKVQISGYVDATRIDGLNQVNQKSKLDLTVLIQKCMELNSCAAHSSHYAVGILVRSILDHVPPIFNCANFKEVYSNYQGSRSFKEAMKKFDDTSRKIADNMLHSQVRKKEELPTRVQVDFSNQLDLLLQEIITILK